MAASRGIGYLAAMPRFCTSCARPRGEPGDVPDGHVCAACISTWAVSLPRERLRLRVLELLQEGRLRDAFRLRLAWDASRVTSWKFGADWCVADLSDDIALAESIRTLRPAILGEIDEAKLDLLRAAAIAEIALGESGLLRQWKGEGWSTGTRFSADVATRMVVFAAWHRRALDDAEAGAHLIRRVASFEISADGGACPACREAARRYKQVELRDLPEIPYPACTAEHGCKCSFRTWKAAERLSSNRPAPQQ